MRYTIDVATELRSEIEQEFEVVLELAAAGMYRICAAGEHFLIQHDGVDWAVMPDEDERPHAQS